MTLLTDMPTPPLPPLLLRTAPARSRRQRSMRVVKNAVSDERRGRSEKEKRRN
jgi:hypothetical protein